MGQPRLSVPSVNKGKPVVMVLSLLLLAAIAGGLTWVLFPRESPPPPPLVESTESLRANQSLVDIPVQDPTPPTPAVEPDAAIEDGGANSESTGNTSRTKRRGKRRRMPEGTIDRRRLAAFIRSKNGQVRQCYERRLKLNNMLQGTLVPQIRIHPSGSVMDVNFVQDTLHDSDVRNCVARLIRGWRFPQPEGGAVTVSNPYRFSPRLD